jgi:hypothetical protein
VLMPHATGFHVPLSHLPETASNHAGRGLQPLSWLFLIVGMALALTLPLAWGDAWGASHGSSHPHDPAAAGHTFFKPSAPPSGVSPNATPATSHGGGGGHGRHNAANPSHPLSQTQASGASAHLATASGQQAALPLSVKDMQVIKASHSVATPASASFEEMPLAQLLPNEANKAAQAKVTIPHPIIPNYGLVSYWCC